MGSKILEHRDIVLFPDEGMYFTWSNALGMLNRICNRTRISTLTRLPIDYLDRRLQCEVNSGEALDDLILRYIKRGLDLADLLINCWKGDVEMFDLMFSQLKDPTPPKKDIA